MRGAGHGHRATIWYIAHSDGGDACGLSEKCTATLIPPIKGVAGRGIQHAHHWQAIFNKPNVDGKGTIIIGLDEFFGAI